MSENDDKEIIQKVVDAIINDYKKKKKRQSDISSRDEKTGKKCKGKKAELKKE